MTKCNEILQSGKSIIEEWTNPPKLFEGILKSDELYEERAVDVATDREPQQFALKKASNLSDSNDNKEKKSSENNNNTVRSIPIKKYRASIAHNIGTLRRSEAPQLQFESSVSEPERNFHIMPNINSTCDIPPQPKPDNQCSKTYDTRFSNNIDGFRKRCGCCDFHQEHQAPLMDTNTKSKVDRRLIRSEQNISTCDDVQDFHNMDEYFHRSNSQRLQSDRQSKKSAPPRPKSSRDNLKNIVRTCETTDLQRGNVGQKISVYELNARQIARDFDAKCRLTMEPKNHRTIGVPLVGMHNACGLPVLASWHEHELLEPMRIRRRVVGTLEPIITRPKIHSDIRRRTHPKRRAPQPNQNTSTKHFTQSRNTESNQNKPPVKSLTTSERCRKNKRGKTRRPSFRSTKVGTYSSRVSRNLSADSLSKRSKFGSSKRRTLYARDDGEDAVQVLKNLCLNPLARTKSDTDMMW